MENNINISSKFNGKYIYKSICFIVLWLFLPILCIITFLIFYKEELLLKIINLIFKDFTL
jgi:hypothetical protein